MRLFGDAEFNQLDGGLISMALVSEDGTREFYEVVEIKEKIHPWVAENVMPILDKEAVPYVEFQKRLKKFLSQFPTIHLVVNHPDDLVHFNRALITGTAGEWMKFQPISMEIDDAVSGKASKRHHNALYDARAQRDSWLRNNGYI
jgi:hypothetical protein